MEIRVGGPLGPNPFPFPPRRGIAPGALAFLLTFATPEALADPGEDGHAHEHAHGDDHGDVEEIVVTASPLTHERDDLALVVERLGRDDVLDELGTTVGETLRNLPGVTNTGFSAGASRPVIRGQDAFRTEVLESGLATHDASRLSPDHGVPVNPITARAVEVVRGPAILRYGGGASAGVVNVLTNRVPTRRRDEPFAGEAIALYGTNEDEIDLAALLEGGAGPFAWHLDGFRRESEDYENGAGEIQRGTHTDAVSGSGGAAWLFDRGRLGVAYTRFENEYGIPEDEPVEIDMVTDRFRLEGDWRPRLVGVRAIKVRGVYSDYAHEEIANGVVGQRFDNDELDSRLEVLHAPIASFIGALGVHGRYQELRAGGEAEAFLAPSETSSAAVYAVEERALSPTIHAEVGLRVETTEVEGTPAAGERRSRSFLPVSASVALIAKPRTGWSIGLTGTSGQRAPSQVELFARGPHEATATFEVGDPKLEEERSYAGDLRIRRTFDRLTLEAAAFVTHYDGFLFGELTGRVVDEDGEPVLVPEEVEHDEAAEARDEEGPGHGHGDLDELFYRARDARFAGGEAAAALDLFELLGGTVSTEWQIDGVHARFVAGSGADRIPRIPPIRWGGALVYDGARAHGRLGFLRAERQRSAASSEFATGAFTMLDLSARYRLPFLEGRTPIDLILAGRNLLDEEARNAVSFTKDTVLLPGRSFRGGVHASF